MIAIKLVLSVIGVLLSVLAYTVAFASVTCAINGAKAIGWPALQNQPMSWLLLILVIVVGMWLEARWVWRNNHNQFLVVGSFCNFLSLRPVLSAPTEREQNPDGIETKQKEDSLQRI